MNRHCVIGRKAIENDELQRLFCWMTTLQDQRMSVLSLCFLADAHKDLPDIVFTLSNNTYVISIWHLLLFLIPSCTTHTKAVKVVQTYYYKAVVDGNLSHTLSLFHLSSVKSQLVFKNKSMCSSRSLYLTPQPRNSTCIVIIWLYPSFRSLITFHEFLQLQRVTHISVTLGFLPSSPDKWPSPCFLEQDSGLLNSHFHSKTFRYSAGLTQACLINKILQFLYTDSRLFEL